MQQGREGRRVSVRRSTSQSSKVDMDTREVRPDDPPQVPPEEHTTTFIRHHENLVDDTHFARIQTLRDLNGWQDYDFAAYFKPLEVQGGDFYEVMRLHRGRFLLVLGDVSGHGEEAAKLARVVMAKIRQTVQAGSDLEQMILALNAEVRAKVRERESGSQGAFVTACLAVFSPTEHRLDCVLAGHHRMMIVNETADIMVRRLGQASMALGIADNDYFEERLQSFEVHLEPGDVLVQYSDGLVEATRRRDGKAYDHHRLGASLLHEIGNDLSAMLERVVERHSQSTHGGLNDDCVMFALARAPKPLERPASGGFSVINSLKEGP